MVRRVLSLSLSLFLAISCPSCVWARMRLYAIHTALCVHASEMNADFDAKKLEQIHSNSFDFAKEWIPFWRDHCICGAAAPCSEASAPMQWYTWCIFCRNWMQCVCLMLIICIYRWHSFCYCEKHFCARTRALARSCFAVSSGFVRILIQRATSNEQLANNLRPIVFYSINCKLFQFGGSKNACGWMLCCTHHSVSIVRLIDCRRFVILEFRNFTFCTRTRTSRFFEIFHSFSNCFVGCWKECVWAYGFTTYASRWTTRRKSQTRMLTLIQSSRETILLACNNHTRMKRDWHFGQC